MKLFIATTLCFTIALFAEEKHPEYFSGGETTVFAEGPKAFSRPLANIKNKTLRHHSVGNSFFNQNWIQAPASAEGRDGLGPNFNARSCSSCHVNDGKGVPPLKQMREGDQKPGMVIKLSIPGKGSFGEPLGHPTYGSQLSDFALPGIPPEAKISLRYLHANEQDVHGNDLTLNIPAIHFSETSMGEITQDIMVSARLAPPVHGMGLIDEISDETILSFADPEDSDGDGISGRPNIVWDHEQKKQTIGKFGLKASQPNLKQQIADAFVNDIGITTSIFQNESLTEIQKKHPNYTQSLSGGSPEADDKVLERIRTYLATVAPPARRNVEDITVRRGQNIFHSIQCASCHIPEMKTRGNAFLPELSNQTIRPYSDFLLHDMGEGSSDHREDYLASGSEWRTPPLWGIGLQHIVSKHSFFLHDGRAGNVIEAILWHGGEAKKSRDQFIALPQSDKEALFRFLQSL